MPKKVGPKKAKKIRLKKEKKQKRAEEEQARAQLVAKSTEEKTKVDEESKILGRQRIKRPERNPKRRNRFSGCNEPPLPPPQLLDAIHEFLLDYRYIKAAHGMRTDNQKRPGHSQDVWKWTSKGLPFLSDIFIQWKDQNPERVNQSTAERKRWLEERERWKAETNEAKRQKRELKRRRRDMRVEAARLEEEKDFEALARMRKQIRKADKEQERLDGHKVSPSGDEAKEDSGSDGDTKMELDTPQQTNKALESGSESDDESDADSSGGSDEDSEEPNGKENVKPATTGKTKKSRTDSAKMVSAAKHSKSQTDKDHGSSDSDSSASSSSSSDTAATSGPNINGSSRGTAADSSSSSSSEEVVKHKTAIDSTKKASSKATSKNPVTKSTKSTSSSSSSSSSSESEAQTSKPTVNGTANPLANKSNKSNKKATSPSSSSSSSSSDSDSDSDSECEAAVKPSAPPTSIPAPVTAAKKRKAPSSSSSSSSPSSSSDSESGGAPLPKKAKKEPMTLATSNSTSTSNSTNAKTQPEDQIAPSQALTMNGTALLKAQTKPFSRIPENIAVAQQFSSNAYIPDSYGQKAYDDLSVVRGRDFTKEKNKKKRGQGFRGGRIDIGMNNAVKFED
ncbi:MAG: hypothetical protein Q9159_004963 [Coniocarpon cinnabarinum]